MLKFFETLLNMSITGAVIIVFVVLIRLFLKKLPRKYSYILWIIPAIRLIIPFSFATPVSVFNYIRIPEQHAAVVDSGEVIDPVFTDDLLPDPVTQYDEYPDSVPTDQITGEDAPQYTGPVYTDELITREPISEPVGAPIMTDEPDVPHSPSEPSITDVPQPPVLTETSTAVTLWRAACAIWATGLIGMLCYLIYSFSATKQVVECSYKIGEGIYSCPNAETPFVFGYIKPKIYIPFGIDDKQEFAYIIAHERTHIKRGDHIIKAIASLILCVHWFNPLAWLAFKLMTVDMELSCDERALNTYDIEARKDYARTLLSMCIVSNKVPFHGMLSFGESSIKTRIKGVLGMKKPAAFVCVLAVAVIITAAVCLLTNAEQTPPDPVGAETTDPAETDVPKIPDGPSPYMAEPDSVGYSFAICADSYEYIVKTEYDSYGRPVKETYLPKFMQADLGYYAYEYDADGRLARWVIGGTLSGVDISVSFEYAQNGYINSVVTYPKLPVHDRNKPYTATVEYHDNGVVKLLKIGDVYRKYDEHGRRTEEAGDSPVPSTAYYRFDDSYERSLVNNGVFKLTYYNESILPDVGYFVFDYGREGENTQARTRHYLPFYDGNVLKGVLTSSVGFDENAGTTEVLNKSDSYAYTSDGKLLPGLAKAEYNEKGQLVSVTYEKGSVTVNGVELPGEAAYIKYTYDDAGTLVHETREMTDIDGQGNIVYKKTHEYTYAEQMRVLTEKGYVYNDRITVKEHGYEITRELHDNGVVKKEIEASYSVGSSRSEEDTVSEYTNWGFIVNRTIDRRSEGKTMRYEYVYLYGASGMDVLDCVEKCYENGKLYYVHTTSYYTGAGVCSDSYEYYLEDGTVGSNTYRLYGSQGRLLKERYYKGNTPYVLKYSYIYGDSVSAIVHTLEQAIDNYLLLGSKYTSLTGKGGLNPKQYSDLKYDTEHDYAGWVAWRYLQSPLAENYGLGELKSTDRVYDVALDYTVYKEDKFSTIAIVVQRGSDSFDVIDEIECSPKTMKGTVSSVGELSADGKWQYYMLAYGDMQYRFYAPVNKGIKVGDIVTVTYNNGAMPGEGRDNITLNVVVSAAPASKEQIFADKLTEYTYAAMKIGITVPDHWSFDGDTASVNGEKLFAFVRAWPQVLGIDPDVLKKTFDGAETVIEGKYGGANDSFAYFMHSKNKQGHRYNYVLPRQGYYVNVYFFAESVVDEATVNAVLASVRVFNDKTKGVGDLILSSNMDHYTINVITVDDETVDYLERARKGELYHFTIRYVDFLNKYLNITGAPAKISEDVLGFSVPEDCIKYTTYDGVLYTKDMKTLVAFPPARTGEFVIPESVEQLADNAFYNSKLSKLIVPDSSKIVGQLSGVNVEIDYPNVEKQGAVADICELSEDGRYRYYLLKSGLLYYRFSSPAETRLSVGDLVTVTFKGNPSFGWDDENITVNVVSHENGVEADTTVEYQCNFNIREYISVSNFIISLKLPSSWSFSGSVAERNDIKIFEVNDVRPFTAGISPERFKVGDGYEVTVVEEKYGTTEDSFVYYVHTRSPEKYAPYTTYDAHRYVVESNGWYVTVTFLDYADVPFSVVESILRTIEADHTRDYGYATSNDKEFRVDVITLDETDVSRCSGILNDSSFWGVHSAYPPTLGLYNKYLYIMHSPNFISSKTEAYSVSEDCILYTVFDGAIYTKDMQTLVAFPPAREGEYTLPDGVKYIDDNAFYGTKLTKLNVPASVERMGVLNGAENVIINNNVEKTEITGTVIDVGELAADGKNRYFLVRDGGLVSYRFTAPADSAIKVGDLVTVVFVGEVKKGPNGENNTVNVTSHEDPNKTVTMVECSYSERISDGQTVTVEFVLPSDWSYTGASTADRNGFKFFEIYGTRPAAEGPAPERYRTATEYQVTVLEERAGTDADIFDYYLYTSTPVKYGPDGTYDVHRYIVEDNGWYITLSFIGDADIPQEIVDEILRSVKIGR